MKCFLELELLVFNLMDYICIVEFLGNDLEVFKVDFIDVFFLVMKMVVSVIVLIIQGEKFEEDEVDCFMEVCKIVSDLLDVKFKIFQYVEFRMIFIVFNFFIIVGVLIVVKFMGLVGGLISLFKMLVCNVFLLGFQKKILSGFFSAVIMLYIGYIYFSEFIQVSIVVFIGFKCQLFFDFKLNRNFVRVIWGLIMVIELRGV